MEKKTVFMPLEDYFARVGIRAAVILCQLPLTLMVVFITALAVLFNPSSLQAPGLLPVLFLHLAIVLICLAVPWHRLPAGSFVAVPVLDCLAVGLTRQVGGPVLSVTGLLMVFPVIWLSVSTRKAQVVLAITAPLVGTVVAPFVFGHDIGQSDLVRMIVLPVTMAGLAITAHFVARSIVRHRGLQKGKDRELLQLHEATRDHEQLLDAVLATVNVGVWALDTNGRDILTNRRLLMDRAAAMKSPSAINPFAAGPDFAAGTDNSFAESAVRGGSPANRLIAVGEGNNQRTYSAAARPLLDGEGRLRGSVIAFTDVTELVEAQTARDKFVATVSHELRTPLTSILGYLELLEDETDLPFVDVIGRNAERLMTLINDLLLVAAEDIELRRRPTEVSGLLHTVVESAAPTAAANGISLETHIEGETTAQLDSGQFSKAIDHLLSNAIKFSPEGSEVTVTLKAGTDGFFCAITDRGIGMDEQELAQAFTKFFRSDHAITTAIPGAGLGLPISKAIIEAHGGSICLDSRPGSGTTVTVSIPS